MEENQKPSLTVVTPESAAIIKAQETHALMQQVVETKITRSELLDIIVGKVAADLEEEEREVARTLETSREKLGLPSALRLLRKGGKVNIERHCEWDGGAYVERGLTVTATITLPVDSFPEKYKAARAKRKDAEAKLERIRSQKNRLQSGKQRARLEMLKTSLEATEEGRKLLEAIDGLKETVRAKLVETR